MPDEVSVIVPVWNGRAMVERLIGSCTRARWLIESCAATAAPSLANQVEISRQ